MASKQDELEKLLRSTEGKPYSEAVQILLDWHEKDTNKQIAEAKKQWQKERNLAKKRNAIAEANAKRKTAISPTKSFWEQRARGDSGNEAERC